jgi:hypothetical protein
MTQDKRASRFDHSHRDQAASVGGYAILLSVAPIMHLACWCAWFSKTFARNDILSVQTAFCCVSATPCDGCAPLPK